MTAATAQEIARVINGYTYRYASEYDIQAAVHQALTDAGVDATREVRTDAGRIDLVVGRIGIEVKTKGPAAAVRRQLSRYALTGDFDELVLVTTRSQHMACGGNCLGRDGSAVNVSVVVLNR